MRAIKYVCTCGCGAICNVSNKKHRDDSYYVESDHGELMMPENTEDIDTMDTITESHQG